MVKGKTEPAIKGQINTTSWGAAESNSTSCLSSVGSKTSLNKLTQEIEFRYQTFGSLEFGPQ